VLLGFLGDMGLLRASVSSLSLDSHNLEIRDGSRRLMRCESAVDR